MSEALTVINNNQALIGGVGMSAGIFKARPQMLELVHKTSRQENVIFGNFRVVGTNEHLGTSIRAVLLAVPQEQREWFRDPAVFTKDNKACFSIDGIRPHARAIDPPAMFCKTCPKGDMNWERWRKTKNPQDLPPCGAYWHLLIAHRETQSPYYLNVKGKSYIPFRQAMETQMSGLLNKIMANVKAENKQRGYTLVTVQTSEGQPFQEFRKTEGWVLPPGMKEQPAPLPMPNIFDISFEIYSYTKDGGPFVMGFRDFKQMKPEDKAEFGQLYLDLVASRAQVATSAEDEEAQVMDTINEPSASAEVPTGELIAPQPPITI